MISDQSSFFSAAADSSRLLLCPEPCSSLLSSTSSASPEVLSNDFWSEVEHGVCGGVSTSPLSGRNVVCDVWVRINKGFEGEPEI